MKQTLLILLMTISFSAFAQTAKKDPLKVDTVQKSQTLTADTKFISLNDLFRKADLYKDSVMARQYESFMVLFNAIVNQLIQDEKKKKQ